MESQELPKYKSHKTVWALKIKDLTEISSDGYVMITPEEEGYNPIVVDKEYMDKHKPSVGGYYVLYEGGYESFSPAKAFERGYRLETASVNFGQAVEALKSGRRVARKGWNGKGMFAYYVSGSTFKINRAPLNEVFGEGVEVTYRPHIDLKAADGTVGVWNPNMMDILAEDWEIL
jgi:hypothetical protein